MKDWKLLLKFQTFMILSLGSFDSFHLQCEISELIGRIQSITKCNKNAACHWPFFLTMAHWNSDYCPNNFQRNQIELFDTVIDLHSDTTGKNLPLKGGK